MFHNSRITDWQGQIVWLVGVTGAFDRALAHELHARGAQVVLSGDAAALKTLVAEQPGLLPLALDVNQRSALAAGCTRIVREHGRLDVVVRCAVAHAPPSARGTGEVALPESVQHLIDTVVPLLLRQGRGHVSLVAGEGEAPGTRGPTGALVERLRAELAPRGIGVSAFHPLLAGPGTDRRAGEPDLPHQAARIAVEALAAGHAGIEAPRRPTMWQKLLGRTPGAN